MSIRSLIIAAAGIAVLTAGAASAQPIASQPVPNPPAHKTVIVKHGRHHHVVKVVRHHHGKTTVTKTVVKK